MAQNILKYGVDLISTLVLVQRRTVSSLAGTGKYMYSLNKNLYYRRKNCHDYIIITDNTGTADLLH
jgi:hypothetical protein